MSGTYRVSSANGIIARIVTAQPKVFRVTGSPRGPIGPNGKDVEIRNNGSAIQWRWPTGTDTTWKDIVQISALVGPQGPAIEMQVSGGYIQWRVVGAVSWTNLIALSALVGPAGADGRTVLNGTGAPGAGLGSNGDFYIDLSTYDIYGPKTAGAWGSPTSLKGPAGAGSGDVTGPASSTANTMPRYSGTTGKVIKGTGITIDDSNNVAGMGTLNGRTLATDGAKLDGIAAGADVTATALAPATHAATAKTTPVDADETNFADSAASFGLKKVTWANIKATLKAFFDAIYPQDSAVVHNTGAETVAGVKTFSSSPIVPTPTTSTQAANKSYVDSGFGSNSFVLSPVAVTGTQNGANPNFTGPEAYQPGSLVVYLNGNAQYNGVDFTETTPASGTFAFVGYNPVSTDQIRVTYQKALTAVTGNADKVDGFDANATPTANTLLPLNSSAKFSPAVIDAPYGEATLASNFLLATGVALDLYVDTGLSITLPAAGTYEISGEFRADFSAPSSSVSTWISWKYYDATAGSFVPRAKRIGPIGKSTAADPITGTTPMTVQYTVTVPTVIKVYLSKHNSNPSGNVTMIGASSDDYGQNVVRYKRIA